MGIFFLLVSFYSFHHYIFIYTTSVFWIAVLYVNTTSVFYLTGPMSYFYVRSVLTDDVTLRKKDWWHFLPAVVHFTCAIPYIVKPWAYKKSIARAIAADYNFMATHKVNYLAQLLDSVKPIYLSRPLLALAYTIGSLIIFLKFQRRQKNKKSTLMPSFHQQPVMKKWLMLFLGFQFLLFLSFASLLLVRWPTNAVMQFLHFSDLESLVGIALIGVLVTPFLFPRILYGLPHFTPVIPEQITIPDSPEGLIIVPAQASAPPAAPVEEIEEEDGESLPLLQLENNYLEAMGEKVEYCMQTTQPYLQASFNLLKLAHLIDVPAHHLGFYFRKIKQQSFNDYRNTWRISYAKKLILEGKADELTLEAIGLQSGFASRSSFFKAFKKITGMSPGQFLEQHSAV